ncbi:nucleoside hydrolase [Leuconostoc gasicomitatum]|uniref:Nucleoside hydrolase n=1 Tax=Leuconostoc gasicomitatum TaxID=115778 RepID=A0A9Q3XSL4_9LACO|nr:nucleoside hydrolase [Leuconostoc gasicomitatum]MBZ5961770.1 nucleoside hydrolase [Leuconostoc gasicomitatum]
MRKQKVIIDADPGIDDSLALLVALRSPKLDVIGISIVEGNVPTIIGVQNALKVLREANRLDIPVFAGAEVPLKHEYVSAQDTHGEDGLGESHLERVTDAEPSQRDAQAGYAKLLSENEDVWFLALGPLTNVAIALQQQPGIWQQVSRLIVMGGADQTNGNTSPVAEYNFWVDPDAADYVFQNSPLNIELVPLDVTRKLEFTPNMLQMMQYLDAEKSKFVAQIMPFYFDFHWQQEHVLGAVINDPLVIIYALHPELVRSVNKYVTVVTDGIALGQSIVDRENFWQKKPNATILQAVDAKAVMSHIISGLLIRDAADIEKELDNIATNLERLS